LSRKVTIKGVFPAALTWPSVQTGLSFTPGTGAGTGTVTRRINHQSRGCTLHTGGAVVAVRRHDNVQAPGAVSLRSVGPTSVRVWDIRFKMPIQPITNHQSITRVTGPCLSKTNWPRGDGHGHQAVTWHGRRRLQLQQAFSQKRSERRTDNGAASILTEEK